MRFYYGWYVVGATFLAISCCHGLAGFNNPVFYPAYVNEFQWGRAVVASGGSLSFAIFGILSPFIGVAIDNQFSVRKTILVGIICFGLSKISFSFMNNLSYFYLAEVMLGMGLACTSSLSSKLFTAKWFRRKEGVALGIVISGSAVGGGLGPLITSYLLRHYGWRETHLVLLAMLWGIALPIFWFVAKEKPQDIGLLPDGAQPQARTQDNEAASFRPIGASTDLNLGQALATKTFWLFCSAILLFFLCIISITEHLVLHLTDLGLNLDSASGALSLLLSGSILGRVGFGALSDGYSKKELIIVAYLFLAVMSFILFLMTIPSAPSFVRSATAMYVIGALIGIGFGGGSICLPLVAGECFGLSSLGKILGLITLFNAIGGAIGPILAGYLFDISGSYQFGFFLASMAAFIAVGCLTFIKTDLRSIGQGCSRRIEVNGTCQASLK
jgi:MFS family permease